MTEQQTADGQKLTEYPNTITKHCGGGKTDGKDSVTIYEPGDETRWVESTLVIPGEDWV